MWDMVTLNEEKSGHGRKVLLVKILCTKGTNGDGIERTRTLPRFFEL